MIPGTDDVRLVYVRDSFAWFVERPDEATGDDWDDAPHECNAGEPYKNRGGRHIKVAYDGDLEIGGQQWNCSPHGLSVDEINRGIAPWLYQGSKPFVAIPAGVTLREFVWLVVQAGGRVYYA